LKSPWTLIFWKGSSEGAIKLAFEVDKCWYHEKRGFKCWYDGKRGFLGNRFTRHIPSCHVINIVRILINNGSLSVLSQL